MVVSRRAGRCSGPRRCRSPVSARGAGRGQPARYLLPSDETEPMNRLSRAALALAAAALAACSGDSPGVASPDAALTAGARRAPSAALVAGDVVPGQYIVVFRNGVHGRAVECRAQGRRRRRRPDLLARAQRLRRAARAARRRRPPRGPGDPARRAGSRADDRRDADGRAVGARPARPAVAPAQHHLHVLRATGAASPSTSSTRGCEPGPRRLRRPRGAGVRRRHAGRHVGRLPRPRHARRRHRRRHDVRGREGRAARRRARARLRGQRHRLARSSPGSTGSSRRSSRPRPRRWSPT